MIFAFFKADFSLILITEDIQVWYHKIFKQNEKERKEKMKFLQFSKIVVIVLCIVLLLGAGSMLVVSTNDKAEDFFNDLFGNTETGSGSGAETEDPEETIPETDTLNEACVHEFDAGAVFKEKTCTSNGVIKYTCSKCEGIKYDVDPAPGHLWDDGKITVQGSCTQKQEITYTCNSCQSTKKVVQNEERSLASRPYGKRHTQSKAHA